MIAWLAGVALADPLQDALRTEMVRSQTELSLPDAPPLYHLRYHLVQMAQVDVQASLGGLLHASEDPFHALGVEVRVGNAGYDNTGFGGWQNGFDRSGLPAVLTPEALRLDAWRLTDGAYKQAVEQYARKRAQFTPPTDYPGDYTLTGPIVHDGGRGTIAEGASLRALAVDLSGALAGGALPLERGDVHIGHEAGWVWTVDTEGSSVQRPVQEATLRAVGHLRTPDGMLLTDHRLWTVRHPDDLPDRAQMHADATRLRDTLQALADAPRLEEEYVGPVLFEESAAADLFRYLLLPQIQGTPPEVPFDSWFGEMGASRDPVRLGRRVLPPGWRVVDDPASRPDHPGSYTHDWEGTPVQAVEVVDDGIVRRLLMSRVPRRGAEGTNGHGRGVLGGRAEGLATGTEVEPPARQSPTRLRKTAFKLAKAYGRDWIVVVRRLQEPAVRHADGGGGGFVFLGAEESGPPLPPPVSIVRVWSDGREETLRGVAFSGVDRWILRDVVGAGASVVHAYLAAPPGRSPASLSPTEGLPSWLIAPEVLVGEVELVPLPGDPTTVPTLPPPTP